MDVLSEIDLTSKGNYCNNRISTKFQNLQNYNCETYIGQENQALLLVNI